MTLINYEGLADKFGHSEQHVLFSSCACTATALTSAMLRSYLFMAGELKFENIMRELNLVTALPRLEFC